MHTIATRLQAKKDAHAIAHKRHRLQQLQSNLVGGVFQQKKRRENEKKLRILLRNSLFLREDEKRRKQWLASLSKIPMDLLERLIPAVLREELRYKQKKRNLIIELNKSNIEK